MSRQPLARRPAEMVDDREIAVPLPTLPGHPVSIREIQTQPHVREEDLALLEICTGTLRITKISPVREKTKLHGNLIYALHKWC